MNSLRTITRWLLAAFLIAAGTAHLIVPAAFGAQLPPWMPLAEVVIAVSGLVEIVLGVALVAIRSPRRRQLLGRAVAVFFAIVWVGNISQAVTGTSGFGLASDVARWVRVAMQPALIGWALWATGSLPSNTALQIKTARADSRDRPDPPTAHER